MDFCAFLGRKVIVHYARFPWPHRLTVRTPGFHPGNGSSILPGAASQILNRFDTLKLSCGRRASPRHALPHAEFTVHELVQCMFGEQVHHLLPDLISPLNTCQNIPPQLCTLREPAPVHQVGKVDEALQNDPVSAQYESTVFLECHYQSIAQSHGKHFRVRCIVERISRQRIRKACRPCSAVAPVKILGAIGRLEIRLLDSPFPNGHLPRANSGDDPVVRA